MRALNVTILSILIRLLRKRKREVLLYRGEGHVILKAEIGMTLLGDEKEAKSQGIQGSH